MDILRNGDAVMKELFCAHGHSVERDGLLIRPRRIPHPQTSASKVYYGSILQNKIR